MNTFQLKTMAAFFMLLDHIAYFFPNMPIVFRWIGRVSDSVFMFCRVIGMRYTSSKEKYLLRLYIASAGMSMFQMISGVELFFLNIICVIYILDKRKDSIMIKKSELYIPLLIQITSIIFLGLAYCGENNNEWFFHTSIVFLSGNTVMLIKLIFFKDMSK